MIRDDKPEPTIQEFDAAVVQLAGVFYLDLSSRDSGETGAPAHAFFKLRIENAAASLAIAQLNDDWMKTALKEWEKIWQRELYEEPTET